MSMLPGSDYSDRLVEKVRRYFQLRPHGQQLAALLNDPAAPRPGGTRSQNGGSRLAAERAAALDAGDVTGMGGMENSMSPRPEPQSQYHASAASKRGFCQQGR